MDRLRNNLTRPLTAGCVALLLALAPGRASSAEPSALELVRTIPLKGAAGRLDHLALDAKGSRLFIANLSNNSLDVVDLKAGALVKQIPGQGKAQLRVAAPIATGGASDWQVADVEVAGARRRQLANGPRAHRVRRRPRRELVAQLGDRHGQELP